MTDSNTSCNHVSRFPAEWWDERRERDYYIDAEGCVQLLPDSPTGADFKMAYVRKIHELFAETMADPKKTDAEKALAKERVEQYEVMTLGARLQ